MTTLADQNEQFCSLKSPDEIWAFFNLKNSVCACTFKLKLHIHDLQKTAYQSPKKKSKTKKTHHPPQTHGVKTTRPANPAGPGAYDFLQMLTFQPGLFDLEMTIFSDFFNASILREMVSHGGTKPCVFWLWKQGWSLLGIFICKNSAQIGVFFFWVSFGTNFTHKSGHRFVRSSQNG